MCPNHFHFYRTRVQSSASLVINWLTDSLRGVFSRLDWCDPVDAVTVADVDEEDWIVVDLEAEVWS